MKRRENFQKALQHDNPDKLILDLGGNPLSSMEGRSMYKMLDFLGYSYDENTEKTLGFGAVRKIDERILAYLDIDTRSVGYILKPTKSQFRKISDEEYIDEWGIRRKYTGMYWDIVDSPLEGAEIDDLEKYDWPDPESLDIEELDKIQRRAKFLFEQTEYVICGEHPVYGVFELGCWMCGFEDFLIKTIQDYSFVHRFFEIVLSYQKKVIDAYYGAIGPFIHYTSSGDDFATQASSFLSPLMFRKLIKPYLQERIKHTKKYTNAAFLHHSCGNVFALIPELIDAGVEILNPIQPVSLDMAPDNLISCYGSQICFHGGLDTQKVLLFNDKERIRNEVEMLINVLAPNGGYIFAAAHNIQEDVNPESVVYAFQTARNCKLPGSILS
jgi:uroporphyrinogen decarboxylase